MAKRVRNRFALYAVLMVFVVFSFAAGSMAGARDSSRAIAFGAGQPFAVGPSPRPVVFPAGPGWLSPQARAARNLIYVADYNRVIIFPKGTRNAPPIGMITDGVSSAYGLFIDADKNLYVCNQSANNVAVYPPGARTPSLTYTQGLRRPLYAIADSQRVFVGNADTGTIAIFEKGHDKLLGTHKTLGGEVDGMAFGTAGYIYAAYRNGGGIGGIEKFPPGGEGPGVDLGVKLNGPQGVVVDPLEDVLAVETQGTNRVDLFLRGQRKTFETVNLTNVPTQAALGDLYQKLYVSAFDDIIHQTSYLQFTPPIDWINNSIRPGIQGMAVSPPAGP